MVLPKKKKPADIVLIQKLIDESGLSINSIEVYLGIAKSVLLRGLKDNPKRALPPRWEQPIIQYLRKKIAEKEDFEKDAAEIRVELGFAVPEPESNLKEELKEVKRGWVGILQG